MHLKTQCHGYNVTYTQGKDSLSWAVRDAEMLIKEGKARTVLVGCHDESTHLFNSLLKRDGAEEFPFIHSIAMVCHVESSPSIRYTEYAFSRRTSLSEVCPSKDVAFWVDTPVLGEPAS